jgi:hypothetical protein
VSGEEVNQMQWVLRRCMEPRIAAVAAAIFALAVTPVGTANQLFPGMGPSEQKVAMPPVCPPIC